MHGRVHTSSGHNDPLGRSLRKTPSASSVDDVEDTNMKLCGLEPADQLGQSDSRYLVQYLRETKCSTHYDHLFSGGAVKLLLPIWAGSYIGECEHARHHTQAGSAAWGA